MTDQQRQRSILRKRRHYAKHKARINEEARKKYHDNLDKSREDNRNKRAKNKDLYRAINKKWMGKNPEIVRARKTRWRSIEANKKKEKISARIYRDKNPEKVRTSYLAWASRNKDYLKARRKEWYDKNKHYSAKWRTNNHDKVKATSKKWRQKNRDKINNNRNIRLKKDHNYKLSETTRSRMCHFLKSKGIRKRKETISLVGCTWPELWAHLESQFRPGMTRENHGPVWHVDHRIPLASAKTEDELLKLFHYTNLQPLFALENLSKNDRLDWSPVKVTI